ncbi:bifunctional diaminohydroxyphosphoribosylaminopyrimidine deaminase/5-amino-6-(5-phosphoribosylamino)uracil reductase RibD [Corynebacterium lizhenjunii]|uniref:Riboflavin biosynthesis protein RibD n=1 Tax=Corynebacterium lizhenjunii TaxID=2709394 RepID=A0A7T0KDD6_9CORY|nr:bifunctional diaminohydroxyphosphoribosylaminopyrimidine deaminase/5-amino-6-(5-phosphoribosylamino)uracil reductase RibD [Corynebacterium lizhenjunii]QPK78190.1 bifunctional diaminohydroxyphosphoribosylaminopyrimidine deaminase/5-amino-6-(5-phosphoribosylamino)uracil reductase RibD [Corynebacterium lizhenjunii]
MAVSVEQARDLAMAAGLAVKGSTSPNPPVGAVILDRADRLVGRGATQPVGGAHAEVMALQEAGAAARGGTAVVTLEPCAHVGRTGACTLALLRAGIARVLYVHADPNPVAAGGARILAQAGVEVRQIPAGTGKDALDPWLRATKLQRPCVTLKVAQTLDGFSAALDGTSQWITSPQSREHAHLDRQGRDALMVGTGTVLADNPRLSARRPDGSLLPQQPRRVVVGSRPVEQMGAAAAHLQQAGFEQYATPQQALVQLWESGARDVLVEGGPGLAGSLLQAGLVDYLHVYIAPLVLGQGRSVSATAVGPSLADAARFQRRALRELGPDIMVELSALAPEG